jgi:hypothetical protein
MHERPRDGNPLPLSAAQFVRFFRPDAADSQPLEERIEPPVNFRLIQSRISPDDAAILVGPKKGDELRVLEHETNSPPPNFGQYSLTAVRDVCAFQEDISDRRPQKAAQNAQKRRLSRPRRPDQRAGFAARTGERHAVQRALGRLAPAERV